MLKGFQKIIEERIRKAQEAGEFENLPGSGQPLNLEDMSIPEGFCNTAWISIYNNLRFLSFGCDLPWFKEKGVAINSCIDGLRPVIFKLERIQNESPQT